VPAFLAPWKRRAAHVRRSLYDVYGRLIAGAKAKAAGPEYPFTPVLAAIVREREAEGEEKERKKQHRPNDDDDSGSDGNGDARRHRRPPLDSELLSVGSGLLDASVDSMHAVVETLFLALVSHPSKLARLRAEVDALALASGDEAPPSALHASRLPYLRACLLEVLRYRTPAPLLIPRMLTRDDTVTPQGYLIPAGTTVLANVHAIHHRADIYDDPESFVPERYLANPAGVRAALWDEERAASASPAYRPTFAFGAGRRKCPGEDFALANMAALAARLVWAFDVAYPPGDAPDVSWERGFSNGLSMGPERFRAVWTLRAGRRVDEIEREYARAMGGLVELVGTGSRRGE
jgi:cytochrome P450